MVQKTDFNSKVNEIVQSKKISNLVKKTDHNTKISNIEKKITDHSHKKYITTPEFNNLAARGFNARLAKANLITKTDLDTELKKK